MDDFLDSVGPILFSAIIILFLVCAPDYFDTQNVGSDQPLYM